MQITMFLQKVHNPKWAHSKLIGWHVILCGGQGGRGGKGLAGTCVLSFGSGLGLGLRLGLGLGLRLGSGLGF